VKRRVFEVPEEFLKHLSSLKGEDKDKDKKMAGETEALCERVEQLVTKLGISDECTGFITDGDLAIPWREKISREHRGTKSVSYSQLSSMAVPDALC